MNSVGEEIRSLRISKKINIAEIAYHLKISKNIVEMIEKDNISSNPDIVFYIGHIRAYCNFLGMDADAIVERFKKQISFKKNTINNELPKISFKESNKNIKNIFPVTLTILIFTSFYFLFIKDNNPQREFASVPDLPEIYLPTVEKESINNISKTNADQNISNKFKKESFNSSSAIASNKISKDADTDTITLKLLNATWLQIRDTSNNIILSKLMDKDDEYTYRASLQYNITAGNAGNILVIVNKNVVGKIGKYGEVIDSIIIDTNFKN